MQGLCVWRVSVGSRLQSVGIFGYYRRVAVGRSVAVGSRRASAVEALSVIISAWRSVAGGGYVFGVRRSVAVGGGGGIGIGSVVVSAGCVDVGRLAVLREV